VLRSFLRAKLHRATVTQADPDYEGSMTVDALLLQSAGIAPLERVLVADITNGERFETYVIEGEPGSGVVSLNGAAAKRGSVGDLVIIMAFGWVDERELGTLTPTVVLLGPGNRILEVRRTSVQA